MTQKEEKQTRREFIIGWAIISAVILSVVSFAGSVVAYLLPGKKKKAYHKYLVARRDELNIGTAKEIIISNRPVFVLRQKDGYQVLSGICTHLGCIVRYEEQKNRFYCPCHQGVFDLKGNVVSGPPPRPLEQFEVKEEGNLVFIMIEDKMEGPWV